MKPLTYREQVPDGAFWAKKLRTLSNGIVLTFEWQGGAYIEVARMSSPPSEVINVWDHDTDQPLIPRTKKAMAERIDQWIREYPEPELIHDVKENW